MVLHVFKLLWLDQSQAGSSLPWAFVGRLSFDFKTIANARRWGQLTHTNAPPWGRRSEKMPDKCPRGGGGEDERAWN